MDADVVGRALVILGGIIALIGIAVIAFSRIPLFGRLPGDTSFQRDGFSFFFPVVTCIILSIVVTIALNIAIRLLR